MDNQHKQIKGYRDLTQDEIDLMNEIKNMESNVLALQKRVASHLQIQQEAATINNSEELFRFTRAEPLRWAAIAKTDFQTGFMALVRSVAQPDVPVLPN